MGVIGFPTSSDIYLELNGKRIAVVQSYRSVTRRVERVVEAFGESEPIATVSSQRTYKLELTRLYATDEAISDGINFHELSGFSLVIVKPGGRVVYTDCQWSEIAEDGALSEMVAEHITLVAAHRVETRG